MSENPPGVLHGWENQYRNAKGQFTRARVKLDANYRERGSKARDSNYGTAIYTIESAFKLDDDPEALRELLDAIEPENAHWDVSVVDTEGAREEDAE